MEDTSQKNTQEKCDARSTQKQLASLVGLSNSFLCDILHERKRPSPKNACKLENVTGVPFKAWLMPQCNYNQLIHKTRGDDYSFLKNQLKVEPIT